MSDREKAWNDASESEFEIELPGEDAIEDEAGTDVDGLSLEDADLYVSHDLEDLPVEDDCEEPAAQDLMDEEIVAEGPDLGPGGELEDERYPEAESENPAAESAPLPRLDDAPAPWRMGVLFMTCLLIACAAIGYAAFSAAGGQLASIMKLDPMARNIMIGAGLLMVALGAIGSSLVNRAMASAKRRYEKAESLVAAVTQLEVGDWEAWEGEEIQSHCGLSRFLGAVTRTVVSHDNELKRFLGLEGELLRLDKAIADGLRDDIADRYDNPMVGSLSDAAVKLNKAQVEARQEYTELRQKLDLVGGNLCEKVMDASRWNSTTLDQVNLQATALEKLVPQADQLTLAVQQAVNDKQIEQKVTRSFESIKNDFDGIVAAAPEHTFQEVADTLKSLVERGGKLALQTAAEVARIQQDGGPLLDLAQDLQNLTTEIRVAASSVEDLTGHQVRVMQASQGTQQKLAGIGPGLLADGNWSQMWQNIALQGSELADSLRATTKALNALPPGFNQQFERLAELGNSWSGLCGASFSAGRSGEASAASTGVLELDVAQYNPFTSNEQVDSPPAATPAEHQPSLSQESEKVYDLAEFGAVALDEEIEAGAAPDDRIYELDEFGAVALS